MVLLVLKVDNLRVDRPGLRLQFHAWQNLLQVELHLIARLVGAALPAVVSRLYCPSGRLVKPSKLSASQLLLL